MSQRDDRQDLPADEPQKKPFPTISRVDEVEAIGTEIGRYKLLSVLGEGGFGIVYLAEQKRPVRRQVALKILKPGMDSRPVIARFEAERQALALLDHPNIARIYDAGATENGQPYFVMEHVKGEPITTYCDQNKLTTEQRLHLFIQVCEGIQYAHQKGIIHRDIKPSNILVTRQGEKAVPKVIDFGVAKAVNQPLTTQTLFTAQGQLIGTPEYMSPEQAELTNRDIDTRSDIYSLGVVLYELICGTLPFDSETLRSAAFDEILRIIRHEEPPRPSTRLSSLGKKAKEIAERQCTQVRALTKRLHNELEWIPLKAMRKECDRRYKTVTDLGEDLQRYLNGEPLQAGPESFGYRLSKTVKRYRTLTAAVVVVMLILTAGIVVSMVFAIRADKAEKRANNNLRLAEEGMQRTNKLLAINQINMAGRMLEQGDIYRASRFLESCPREYWGWEWRHLWKRFSSAGRTKSLGVAPNNGTCFSPDMRYIASGSWDGKVYLWDIDTGRGRQLGDHGSSTYNMAFSLDGLRVVSLDAGGTVKLWDIHDGTLLYELDSHDQSPIVAMDLDTDGSHIVAVSVDGTVAIWDTAVPKNDFRVARISGPRFTRHVEWSSDGLRVLTSGYGLFRLYDVVDDVQLVNHFDDKFKELEARVATFTNDGHRVVFCDGNDVGIINIRTEEIKRYPVDFAADIITMSSNDQHVLLAGSNEGVPSIVEG